MILQAEIRASYIGPASVIPDRTIKKVQTNTVRPVWSAHLGIEVVKRAAVVLVDVSVFNKYAPRGVSQLGPEALCDTLRVKLRV